MPLLEENASTSALQEFLCRNNKRAAFDSVKEDLSAEDWDTSSCSLQALVASSSEKSENDAFFITDIGEVLRLYQNWTTNLPGIQPFYAVKCNPSIAILKTIAALGGNFDCASKYELELVLSLGVAPERIIYANPCKQISAIKYAQARGVRMMTFDNANELDKIEKHHPQAQLILRLAVDNSKSMYDLSSKFGALPEDYEYLFKIAQSKKLDVVGVAFHVGCSCMSETAFEDSLQLASKAFKDAKSLGIDLKIVDIGGGFSATADFFKKCADVIRRKRAELFDSSVQFIAEPGRYFSETTTTLAVKVIAKRVTNAETNSQNLDEMDDGADTGNRKCSYYVSDGTYGSLTWIVAESKATPYQVQPSDLPSTKCTIYGPTCCGLDVIMKDGELPEMEVDDWIYFKETGAYTNSCATNFNGFSSPDSFYVSSV